MAYPLIKKTYTGTEEQSEIILSSEYGERLIFSLKQGDSDISTIQVKIHPLSQWVSLPNYRDFAGDEVGRLPSGCYAIRLNITANVSGEIILEVTTQ
jgi:hypothetical protein